jgi:D-beta-D-heptose 7-phosphate kinase / D-beta-D-heptose 1-phosphate adenosyltransferase
MSNDVSVLVVGDLIIDQYVTGKCNRLSPEAPVPVLSPRSSKKTLGGSGNVARILAAFGMDVSFIGLAGQTDRVDDMDDSSSVSRIKFTMLRDADYRIPKKLRYVADGKHLLRVDEELPKRNVPPSFSEKILPAEIPKWVILSDYNKTNIVENVDISNLRKAGAFVLVDPKVPEWSVYKNCNLIKPNEAEFIAAVGHPIDRTEYVSEAQGLLAAHNIDTMLLTLGADGAMLIDKGRAISFPNEQPSAIYDVSGAGDTVLATLCKALSLNLPLDVAVRIALDLAQLSISKPGVYHPNLDEFNDALIHNTNGTRQQSIEKVPLSATNGCFDVLHSGHFQSLMLLRTHGVRTIVFLNSDASVVKLKGINRPYFKEAERRQHLLQTGLVDEVIIFDTETELLGLIQKYMPNVIVKGCEYQNVSITGQELIDQYGGTIIYAERKVDLSTTEIEMRILQNA